MSEGPRTCGTVQCGLSGHDADPDCPFFQGPEILAFRTTILKNGGPTHPPWSGILRAHSEAPPALAPNHTGPHFAGSEIDVQDSCLHCGGQPCCDAARRDVDEYFRFLANVGRAASSHPAPPVRKRRSLVYEYGQRFLRGISVHAQQLGGRWGSRSSFDRKPW